MLERGILCVLIGIAVLLGPRFLQSPMWRDMVGGAYLVGWFALVLGLALVEGAMDADSVWHAARIDDDWQVERWGEDELATRTTEAHRAEFDAAVRFLAALRG